jgi:hypothetical protein
MKILGLPAALIALCVCHAADPSQNPNAAQPESTLVPARIEVIYLANGRITTVQLAGNKHPPHLIIGAPIVAFQYDSAANQIQLTPRVDDGETNMNMTVDGQTYVIVLKMVRDLRVQYLRTFTIANASGEDDAGDEVLLEKARPMKPVDIDIVTWVRQAERAQQDPIYKEQKLQSFRNRTIGRTYDWNDNVITLVEVDQFIDKDLLLFKAEWVNRSRDALYLNARQYGVRVANQRIPVVAAMQDAPDSIIYPGQHEVVWLAVQGYRLRRENQWELVLPPDSNAVAAMAR